MLTYFGGGSGKAGYSETEIIGIALVSIDGMAVPLAERGVYNLRAREVKNCQTSQFCMAAGCISPVISQCRACCEFCGRLSVWHNSINQASSSRSNYSLVRGGHCQCAMATTPAPFRALIQAISRKYRSICFVSARCFALAASSMRM